MAHLLSLIVGLGVGTPVRAAARAVISTTCRSPDRFARDVAGRTGCWMGTGTFAMVVTRAVLCGNRSASES